MRDIYAEPVEAAETRFAVFAWEWHGTYPAMISAREQSWSEFAPFLALPRLPGERREAV